MRKILLAFFTLLTFFVVPAQVFAQTPTPSSVFDFQKAYQDFVFTYDQYRVAEGEFEIARSQYIQSKTLASQAKAQEATYKLLQIRDEVVKTYLTTLRLRLAEAVGVTSDQREVFYKKIDTEVNWFDDHKNKTSSAGSLNDLTADSNKAKARYDSETTLLIYQTLTSIGIGKGYFLRQKQLSIVSELSAKLGAIRQDGEMDTDFLERNVLEVQTRIQRGEGKETEANTKYTALTSGPIGKSTLTVVTRLLGESVQYYKEANTIMKEIISRIKGGN